jgi:hypothetical protein
VNTFAENNLQKEKRYVAINRLHYKKVWEIMTMLYIQQAMNNDTQDKWKDWEAFRGMNREYAFKVVFQRNKLLYDRALILGAGNGNDIDIEYLENTFSEITIVDIDEIALNRLILKANYPNKFIKKIIDLSGVSHLLTSDIFSKPLIEIENIIQTTNPEHDFSDLSGNYDFILNSNYTSQLIFPYIESNLLFKNIKSSERMIELMGDLTVKIITDLFEIIHGLLNTNGVLIHSTDLFEISANSKTKYKSPAFIPVYINTLDSSINNIDRLNDAEVVKKINDYMIIGNFTPNYEGKFKLESIRHIPWRFTDTKDEIRYYICRVVAFIKK